MGFERADGRSFEAMRDLRIEVDSLSYAEGSCMVELGRTRVLCSASVEDSVPSFLRGSGEGWVTAEYNLLPRSTHRRVDRESHLRSGRRQEIQRLIGRSVRSVCDRRAFADKSIKLDCDVIQADGGTRSASVIGAYIALAMAFLRMRRYGVIDSFPLAQGVGALSCGIVAGEILCDLCYEEDVSASVDANFVLAEDGSLVEVQASAEKGLFTGSQLDSMLSCVGGAMGLVYGVQRRALGEVEARLKR